MQVFMLVVAGLMVFVALFEAHAKDANWAIAVITALTIMVVISEYQERQMVNKTIDIVQECLDGGNAAKFRGDIYIGCFAND